MRTVKTFVLRALGAVAGLLFLIVVGWVVDTSRHDGRVLRNVTLAGRDVGGLDRQALSKEVADLAARYATSSVRVDAQGGGFSTSAADLRLSLEQNATVQAALDVGRHGPAPRRLAGWLTSLVSGRRSPIRINVDPPSVYRVVAAKDPARVPATEPGIRVEKGKLVPIEGKPGSGIDAAKLIAALPDAAAEHIPILVETGRGPVAPRFTRDDAARLAEQGDLLAARPMVVTADDDRAEVSVATLRSWLRSEPTDKGLRLAIQGEEVAADLGKLLTKAGTPAVETGFDVVDGVVRVLPGTPGSACCSPVAGGRIEQALRSGRRDPVQVPLKRVDPKLTTAQAEALGIREPVATFTTNHKPNQPRVQNIHRISDLVRGQVIPPGKTFSVNEFVGKRTLEKGFVVDHVIEDGRFTESVGGGISQFATTTFNAAFLAGLEFVEYQSHSLVIGRYPYGREATLSYPHPDLKIRNPSPYGVLIWPTYSDKSVTVTLYSTRWVEATQTNQTREPRGPCTRVRTERTRRFLADGTVKVDHVSALYRPEEGVNCS
ncbi:MAG TPA: VanW family protein [Acidimicrobiales bacterium]|nr:VanW family protein [Acidimicrobiales bacterium]